jgi:hypothetical protein
LGWLKFGCKFSSKWLSFGCHSTRIGPVHRKVRDMRIPLPFAPLMSESFEVSLGDVVMMTSFVGHCWILIFIPMLKPRSAAFSRFQPMSNVNQQSAHSLQQTHGVLFNSNFSTEIARQASQNKQILSRITPFKSPHFSSPLLKSSQTPLSLALAGDEC